MNQYVLEQLFKRIFWRRSRPVYSRPNPSWHLLRLFLPIFFLVFFRGHTGSAYAILLDSGTLSFASIDQSMWGSGTGTVPQTTGFSRTWSASTGSIGGITGSKNEAIIPSTPASPAITKTFDPLDYAHLFHEVFDFRHTHHCHSIFCLGIDPHDEHTHYKTHIHDGGSKTITLVPAFSGRDAVTADTRTGIEASLSTTGSVSMENNFGLIR